MNKEAPISKPFLAALAGQPVDRIPIWLMRQAGRYLPEYRETRASSKNFLHFCYTPELAVEATLQPIRRYGFDAAIIFSDILVIPDALGQNVEFVPGRGPVLEALSGPGDVKLLQVENIAQHLAPVYQAIREVYKALPDEVAMVGFAGAPWTIASYMVEGGSSRDFAKLKTWAYGDAAGFQKLIDLLVNAISDHLVAQVDAGAEALQIFDSWAGVLPEHEFNTWCLQPIRRIVDQVKTKHPDIPIIAFPKGAGFLYEKIALETGVDAVSIDPGVTIEFARDQLQQSVTVQGNLDPLMLVVGGDPMQKAVNRILEGLGRGRFVFNLGHGILPQTPPEHVAQLVDTVRQWQP